jgi:hypothetical protein
MTGLSGIFGVLFAILAQRAAFVYLVAGKASLGIPPDVTFVAVVWFDFFSFSCHKFATFLYNCE